MFIGGARYTSGVISYKQRENLSGTSFRKNEAFVPKEKFEGFWPVIYANFPLCLYGICCCVQNFAA